MEKIKIVLLGYGRMGHLILDLLRKQNEYTFDVTIVEKTNNGDTPKNLNVFYGGYSSIPDKVINTTDFFIEFTNDNMLPQYLSFLSTHKALRIISGSTKWNWKDSRLKEVVNRNQHFFLHSPNFSIGIYFLNFILKKLASTDIFNYFDTHIVEYHHKHKKDAPSGTAKMLYNTLFGTTLKTSEITSIRTGEIPGIHTIIFDSMYETIELTHQARDRRVFASGVVSMLLKALDLYKKSLLPIGFFTLEDFFSINNNFSINDN